MTPITGSIVAIVTPMHDDGSVDYPCLRTLIDWHIDQGTDCIGVVGTTGESPTVSVEEHCEIIRVAVEQAKGRVPIMAGCGANSTAEAIELTRFAHEVGADCHLQVVPYYNKPPQDGLIRHFEAIADAVALPVVLYNVPGRTVLDMVPETVAVLARHPNIVGIKDATGDMHVVAQLRELCGPDFCLMSGDDFTLLPFLATGGDGVISVVSNPAPALLVALQNAFDAGKLDLARELHFRQLRLTRLLFAAPNPIAVKAALHLLGRCGPDVRLPLCPLDLESKLARDIVACLRELELLP